MQRYVPNILSVSRIILCIVLFSLTGYPVLFTVLYFVAGITDIADGFLARYWKVESSLGAKLDSLGDFILYTLIVWVFLVFTSISSNATVKVMIVSIFICKAIALTITKIKFGQWGMIHTLANKLSGLLVYFSLPAYILYPGMPMWVIVIICSFALFASIEENAIVLFSKTYDINHKSLFIRSSGIKKNRS